MGFPILRFLSEGHMHVVVSGNVIFLLRFNHELVLSFCFQNSLTICNPMNSQLLTLNSQILISTLNLDAASKLGTKKGGGG